VTVASQTITQTLTTTAQSTCPVTTHTETHTETSHTTRTTRTTTTTTNPSCKCKLHYVPIRHGGDLPYDVVVPCDAAWYECYIYTDSNGQVWQVCRTTEHAPGTTCPIKDC
jgi:hypothetical protein